MTGGVMYKNVGEKVMTGDGEGGLWYKQSV